MKSNRAMMISACVAVAVALLPCSALAQSGFSENKEITTADAASKLLQPADSTASTGLTTDLAPGGIVPIDSPVTKTVDSAPAPAPAPTIVPYAAEAGPLTVFNCSGAGIKVKTYNSNDTMLWVAYQEISIANGASAGLKCATSTCKLKVNSGGATAAKSGYQVYIGGAVKATNKAAIGKGCAVYAPPPA